MVPVDAITLKKALAEAKLIETVTTNGTVRYTIQKRVGAAKPYVLDLKLDALVFTRDSEDKPEKKTESKTPQPIDFLGSYEEKSPLSSLSSKITGEGEGGACISRVTCAKEKDAEGVSFLNKKNEDSEDNYKNTPINTSGNPVFTRQETVKMNEAREGTRKKASKPRVVMR